MSKPQDKKDEDKEPPAEKKKPSLEDVLAQVVKGQEENRKSISTIASAIVKLNEKIEAKGSGKGGGTDPLSVIAKLAGGEQTSLEGFARQADAFAKAADALNRYRHPSRLGVGEALLMRLGMRAAYPRYMTKTELDKMEKAAGVWETLEATEETGHVSE